MVVGWDGVCIYQEAALVWYSVELYKSTVRQTCFTTGAVSYKGIKMNGLAS